MSREPTRSEPTDDEDWGVAYCRGCRVRFLVPDPRADFRCSECANGRD